LNPDIIAQLNNLKLNEIDKSLFDIKNQMKQYDSASILNFRTLPDILSHNAESVVAIDDFRKQNNLGFEFNINIAKDDIMFLNSLAVLKDFNLTCERYLSAGYSGFSIIRKIINDLYGDKKFNGQILDFASGYGRVSRFLAAYYGENHVTVSDIKKESVDFQKKYFKVKGLYSDYAPEQFSTTEKFDVIFVGSLFTHLPETLFNDWMAKLLSLLNKGGYLVFSVHGLELFPGPADFDFYYGQDNEDSKFAYVQNRITSTDVYGVSFASEKFVKDVLQKIDATIRYRRYPKLFSNLQDVYVATYSDKLPAE